MTIASKIFGSLSKKKATEAEKTTAAPVGQPIEPITTESQPPQFGIKSYLHEFYDLKTPEEGVEGWYFTSPAPRKRGILLCRAFFAIGICLLVIGAVGIIVGYLWPDPLAKFNESEESGAEPIQFEASLMPIGERIKIVKIVALVLFALGGFTVAVALLIPTCCRLRGEESLLEESGSDGLGGNETAIICAGERVEQSGAGSPKMSVSTPVEKKIPLMEEIQSVQPAEKKGSGRSLSGSELLLTDE